MLDDLALIRDAGGLNWAGADRLQGVLFLLYGGTEWSEAQIVAARDRIATATTQTCLAHAVLHRGQVCEQAAAISLETILTQEPDSFRTLRAIRSAALLDQGCHLEADSLRKRELPIMRRIAAALYASLQGEQQELLLNKDSIMSVLRPYADLAGDSVALAAKLFSQRAALANEDPLYKAVSSAIWAVASFGVLPLYGLQRMEALGVSDITDETIVYLLVAIAKVPFTVVPDDLNQLATAIQLGESSTEFYDRLLRTPVMLPVVRRFVEWLTTHDPKVCLYDSNDVIVGYCGPHYYAAMCDSFVDAANDYSSGALGRDLEAMLDGLGLHERRRRRS